MIVTNVPQGSYGDCVKQVAEVAQRLGSKQVLRLVLGSVDSRCNVQEIKQLRHQAEMLKQGLAGMVLRVTPSITTEWAPSSSGHYSYQVYLDLERHKIRSVA